MKFSAALAAFFLFLAGPVLAQNVLPAIQGPNGPVMADPVVQVAYDTITGKPCVAGSTPTCPAGGGGGGGTLGVNASSAPTPITAGSNKALNVGLFSNLFATWVDASGTPVDLTVASPVQCGPFASPVTCALASKQCTVDANGACAVPETALPVVTKTTLTANTSTTVCPAATHPMTTEIYLNTAPSALGLGLKGQSLSTDAWGAGSTAADYVLSVAGTLYTAPVGYSGVITARSAGTPNVTCVQTLRP